MHVANETCPALGKISKPAAAAAEWGDKKYYRAPIGLTKTDAFRIEGTELQHADN